MRVLAGVGGCDGLWAGGHFTFLYVQEPVVFIAGHAFGDNEFLLYGTTAYQGLMHIRYDSCVLLALWGRQRRDRFL